MTVTCTPQVVLRLNSKILNKGIFFNNFSTIFRSNVKKTHFQLKKHIFCYENILAWRQWKKNSEKTRSYSISKTKYNKRIKANFIFGNKPPQWILLIVTFFYLLFTWYKFVCILLFLFFIRSFICFITCLSALIYQER